MRIATAGKHLGWLLLGAAIPAHAQDRAADNAVTQAEDGFGFSVGREALGIYNAGNVRGFSPAAAGNQRLDGLYIDPVAGIEGLIADSNSIKVGLSAQGYAFAAPSGIADTALRRPEFSAGASVVASFESFGTGSIEVTGSLPISSTLALGFGTSGTHTEFPDGTSNWNHGHSLTLRWKPSARAEVIGFWTLFNDYDDESGPFYIPAGKFLPPVPPPRRFDGPDWADFRFTNGSAGVLATVSPADNWTFRLGAFRTFNHQIAAYTNLLLNLQPDGTYNRLLIADPDVTNRSLSGEARLSHSIAEGPRLHVFHLSLRERDVHREFDGSDEVDLGPGRIGTPEDSPRPNFTFGPTSRDRVRQETIGLAYAGRWRNVGELGLGLSHASYHKRTLLPGQPAIANSAHPWLWNANVAPYISPSLSLYAGYARGLEESGLAPASAANRNAPLPAIITTQKDAGIRWAITPKMKLVAGVFDLARPYFGYDSARTFRQVGTIRDKGFEFSLSGPVTGRLNLVVGGVFYHARVERDAAATGNIGPRPVGIPGHLINLNLNWRAPILEGLSFDAAAALRDGAPSTTDNLVYLPSRTIVNLGSRYRFRLAGKDATFRVQVANVLGHRSFAPAGPGAYFANNGRFVNGFLTVDL